MLIDWSTGGFNRKPLKSLVGRGGTRNEPETGSAGGPSMAIRKNLHSNALQGVNTVNLTIHGMPLTKLLELCSQIFSQEVVQTLLSNVTIVQISNYKMAHACNSRVPLLLGSARHGCHSEGVLGESRGNRVTICTLHGAILDILGTGAGRQNLTI